MRIALRYFSTLRSSSGIARMTITPDWGLTTTFLPGPAPIRDRSAIVTSFQKSLCETIDTRLASRDAVAMELRPNAPRAGGVACPGVPAAAAPAGVGGPPPPWGPEIAPELTRTSLRPERRPIR